MFQPWRLKLREAETALAAGRLEEAGRLLNQDGLLEFLPAKKLMAKVAQQLAQRGQAHVQRGQSSAGWHDLERAVRLGAEDETLATLRQQLVEHALAEAEQYLEAGQVDACLSRLDALQQRHTSRDVRQLRQVAEHVAVAQRSARAGEFAQAEAALAPAREMRPRLKLLQQLQANYQGHQADYRRLSEQLHRLLSSKSWTEVMATAEELLKISPDSPLARDARQQAWKAVGVGKRADRDAATRPATREHRREALPRVIGMMEAAPSLPESRATPPGRRFVLWIDGVGGYLVCEGNEVVIGQPTESKHVDVPILADLSRDHARIIRQGEGYLIRPLRPTRVGGRKIKDVTSLSDGQLIELGDAVKLRFRRPHPLSATARLEFVSHHRTRPAADAVLLMSESCLLGPAEKHHITCLDWSGQVVLFRQQNDLCCRSTAAFQVDGAAGHSPAILHPGARVSGDDFSFSVEML